MQKYKSLALGWDFQRSLGEVGTQIPLNPPYTFSFSFSCLFIYFGHGKDLVHVTVTYYASCGSA